MHLAPPRNAPKALYSLGTCYRRLGRPADASRAWEGLLTSAGEAHHYAGNVENPVFTFDLDAIHLACTGMYSRDRSVFKFVVPEATNRRLVPRMATASL